MDYKELYDQVEGQSLLDNVVIPRGTLLEILECAMHTSDVDSIDWQMIRHRALEKVHIDRIDLFEPGSAEYGLDGSRLFLEDVEVNVDAIIECALDSAIAFMRAIEK